MVEVYQKIEETILNNWNNWKTLKYNVTKASARLGILSCISQIVGSLCVFSTLCNCRLYLVTIGIPLVTHTYLKVTVSGRRNN